MQQYQHGDRISMTFKEFVDDVPVIHEVIRAPGKPVFAIPQESTRPAPVEDEGAAIARRLAVAAKAGQERARQQRVSRTNYFVIPTDEA